MLMSTELLQWAMFEAPQITVECGTTSPYVEELPPAAPTSPPPIAADSVAPLRRKATISPMHALAAQENGSSQAITAPSSPSAATLRHTVSGQSLLLTRRQSEIAFVQTVSNLAAANVSSQQAVHSPLSRTSSMTQAAMKTRALGQAASNVVQHTIQVGACCDPRCLMFYDPEVFTAPTSLSSRQRVASFRRHGGRTLASPHQATLTMLDVQNFAEEDDDDEDAFDLKRLSRRLFSSAAQQSMPLKEYLVEVVAALSSSQSPIRSTPETFVFALVLLERAQHMELLGRSSGGVQHPGQSGGAGLAAAPNALSLAHLPSSPTSGSSPLAANTTQSPEDRIRCFLDETPAVRLTKESLQGLGGLSSAVPSRTPTCTETESCAAPGEGLFVNQPMHLCADCLEQQSGTGISLHGSNVHLFIAAAVLIAIKVREDFATGPRVLSHVCSLLHCSSPRLLFHAERCLCDALGFDVTVSVSEYRLMLRQLNAHRAGDLLSPSAGALPCAAEDATSNFMTLFASA